MKYLKDVVTLKYDPDKCKGCKQCVFVCPHAVFKMEGNKALIVNKDSCMECGACMLNCEFEAICVRSGVGCASGIINGLLSGGEAGCDCGDGCCC